MDSEATLDEKYMIPLLKNQIRIRQESVIATFICLPIYFTNYFIPSFIP